MLVKNQNANYLVKKFIRIKLGDEMKWVRIGDRYRVNIEAVRCYGIPRNEPTTIEFDYGNNDNDKFGFDSEQEARDMLKEVDIAIGLYSIQED